MPTRERLTVKDPNYARFYEFDPGNSEVCSECPAKCGTVSWTNVLKRVRGVPVHTNWPLAEAKPPSTVYICESPSNREFSHGLPSVGRTGQAIFKKEYQKSGLSDGWLDRIDLEIYRTNLVRCQADSGLQKRVDHEKKQRVNDAAPHCINHLRNEISLIASAAVGNNVEMHFVVAVGAGFPVWVRDVKELIKSICQDKKTRYSLTDMDHPSAK